VSFPLQTFEPDIEEFKRKINPWKSNKTFFLGGDYHSSSNEIQCLFEKKNNVEIYWWIFWGGPSNEIQCLFEKKNNVEIYWWVFIKCSGWCSGSGRITAIN
jgi:hypothetical protein